MKLHQIGSNLLWLVVGIVCLEAGIVQAEGSFRDEFVNPDPTNPNREPVTWVSERDSEVLIQNEDEGPTVTVRDSLYSDGRVGVYVDDVVTNGATQATFRYSEAVVIPEPSTLILSLLGLLHLVSFRR